MKLSSPYLNILIVVGVVLFYLDVILFGVDEGTPAPRCSVNALCMVRQRREGKRFGVWEGWKGGEVWGMNRSTIIIFAGKIFSSVIP